MNAEANSFLSTKNIIVQCLADVLVSRSNSSDYLLFSGPFFKDLKGKYGCSEKSLLVCICVTLIFMLLGYRVLV